MNLKESIKFLAKDSLFYGVTTSLVKVAPLLIYPILNRILPKESIGSLDIAMANGSYFIILTTLGLDSGVARFYYDSEDPATRKKVISNALFIMLSAGILLLVLSPLLFQVMNYLVFESNNKIGTYWYIYVLSVPAQSLFLFSQTLFKYRFERKQFAFLTFGFTSSYIILFYLYIYVFELTDTGILYSQLASYYLFAFAGLMMIRKSVSLRRHTVDLEFIKKLLKYSLPFALVTLFSLFIAFFDRSVLFHNIGMGDTAYYSNAVKVASIFGMFISAFSISSGPFIMSKWKEPNFRAIISRILNLYLLGAIPVAIIFLLFKEPLIEFFCTRAYMKSGSFIPMLVFSQILEGLFVFSFIGLNYAFKSWMVLYIYMAAAISSILVNMALVPYIGIWGACFSLIFSKLLLGFISFFISNRHLSLHFSFPILIIFSLNAFLLSYFSEGSNFFFLTLLLVINIFIFIYFLFKQKNNDQVQMS